MSFSSTFPQSNRRSKIICLEILGDSTHQYSGGLALVAVDGQQNVWKRVGCTSTMCNWFDNCEKKEFSII
jgi:hypothetical protein